MTEYGGYIELEQFRGKEYHKNCIALNCAHNALSFLINKKRIHNILIPYFLCDSVYHTCKNNNVHVKYYRINSHFIPECEDILKDEYIYIVNYYGQLRNRDIKKFVQKYKDKVIIDNVQAFYAKPLENVNTIYGCRKFFGVPDGAYLYTDELDNILALDESFERMEFLLGRYERTASEFYQGYIENNKMLENEPIKRMSKLTKNLLRGIDYNFVAKRRTDNFKFLHRKLSKYNKLSLMTPKGAFMYPFWTEKGTIIRENLQKKKIYIPTLWPNVIRTCHKESLEYNMAKNILPLPIDQRYFKEDMEYIANEVIREIDINGL